TVRPGGTDLRAGSNATRQHARMLAPSKRWSISLVSGVSATVTCVRFARKLPLLQPFRTSGCRKRPDSVPEPGLPFQNRRHKLVSQMPYIHHPMRWTRGLHGYSNSFSPTLHFNCVVHSTL